MSPDQIAYWREKGIDALADHLYWGWGDDGTPLQFELGNFYDAEECGSGIELYFDADLVVRDEDGEIIYDDVIEDFDLGSQVIAHRFIHAPSAGAFFRTYEKGELGCELELTAPFDPDLLKLGATGTPRGALLNRISYAGNEIEADSFPDKEWALRTVEMIA